MVLQGFLLFGFNYFFVYISEQYLTSGIVAAGFSLVIFLNAIFGAIFLKVPLNPVVIISGFIGVSGVLLIFKDDIEALSLSSDSFRGMIYCILSVVFASLGNITSAYNQRKKLPVIQTNMYGMLYGAIILILTAFVSGGKISFDTSIPYIGSLLYLAIFGSVLAFGTYLKLIGEIGPDKAAFVLSVVPLIALIISSVFEDLEWTIFTISGTIMIIIANYITLAKRTKLKYSTK